MLRENVPNTFAAYVNLVPSAFRLSIGKGAEMASRMNPSVLVVDGRQQTAEVIRDGLREMGLRDVSMVSDSERALRRAAEHEYALVIVDEHVAPLNGLALLRTMRDIRKNASTRYIFVSASGDTATLLAAKAGGVNGFLLKPCSLASLRRTVDRVLGEPAAKAA